MGKACRQTFQPLELDRALQHTGSKRGPCLDDIPSSFLKAVGPRAKAGNFLLRLRDRDIATNLEKIRNAATDENRNVAGNRRIFQINRHRLRESRLINFRSHPKPDNPHQTARGPLPGPIVCPGQTRVTGWYTSVATQQAISAKSRLAVNSGNEGSCHNIHRRTVNRQSYRRGRFQGSHSRRPL